LLVDGYNVCGYWIKLKKHFLNGKLELARQKLIDELITFSMLREVKVVVVFDAMMSGFPNHKEYSSGIDVVFSTDASADTWIEKEVSIYYFIFCTLQCFALLMFLITKSPVISTIQFKWKCLSS